MSRSPGSWAGASLGCWYHLLVRRLSGNVATSRLGPVGRTVGAQASRKPIFPKSTGVGHAGCLGEYPLVAGELIGDLVVQNAVQSPVLTPGWQETEWQR